MMTVQEILATSFHSLVKNRLGPYKLVLKNDEGTYVAMHTQSLASKDAFDYATVSGSAYKEMFEGINIFNDPSYYLKSLRGSNFKPYLTTSAGDIELIEANFGPQKGN
jgi:hypothetical protein